MSGSVAVAAAAKINLCLHVTGRRADGYHTIDSLMAFVGLADRLVAEAAPDGQLTLAVEGPFGRLLGPTGEDNIVLRAARALARAAGSAAGAKLTLGKFIPVAAGLGGGSADAAATLNALARLWGVPGSLDLRPIALALGADVPVCLAARPAHVTGIGENLGPVAALPDCGVLLVNPRIGLETRAVFAAFDAAGAGGSAAPPVPTGPFADARALARALGACRNDLTAAAVSLAPQIARVIEVIAASGDCLLARMSGSGATCFGLFADQAAAASAARAVSRAEPGWWVWSGGLGAGR